MSNNTETIDAYELGRVRYKPTWDLQEKLQETLIEAHRSDEARHPAHPFLLVEHPPVYTLGKNGDNQNLLFSAERLEQIGATFYQIDRGGDVTYHGPGQLVGYPILDLNRFSTDIGWYLRSLEEVIIRTCAGYGIDGYRVDGRTGVWTKASGAERKICAIGIRCSRWVTMHGFAFNINTDLNYFSEIVPCGIANRGVTSLQRELDRPIDRDEVVHRVLDHFESVFEANIRFHADPDGRARLSRIIPETEQLLRKAQTPTD